MTDTSWIDQVQARCDEIFDEEWRMEVRGTPMDGPTHIAVVADGVDGGDVVTHLEYSKYGDAVAEFIVAARTDLPRALKALRDLSARHHLVTMRYGGQECACGRTRYCDDLAIIRDLGEDA